MQVGRGGREKKQPICTTGKQETQQGVQENRCGGGRWQERTGIQGEDKRGNRQDACENVCGLFKGQRCSGRLSREAAGKTQTELPLLFCDFADTLCLLWVKIIRRSSVISHFQSAETKQKRIKGAHSNCLLNTLGHSSTAVSEITKTCAQPALPPFSVVATTTRSVSAKMKRDHSLISKYTQSTFNNFWFSFFQK